MTLKRRAHLIVSANLVGAGLWAWGSHVWLGREGWGWRLLGTYAGIAALLAVFKAWKVWKASQSPFLYLMEIQMACEAANKREQEWLAKQEWAKGIPRADGRPR